MDLSSRTPFAGFLAKTFHIHRCGSSPASVTFPLPLPQLGLFRGGGPKLSHRRWICLLRKRTLHLVVVALNFLHYGYSPSVLQQLGRRPNALQLQIYSRLWALIVTCDSPGEFPISPGRSGPEFVSRLFELQRFAMSCPVLGSGSYNGREEDGGDAVGSISRSHAFVPEGDPGAFAPYRSLDPSRLKLTGSGSWPLEDFLDDELWLPYLEPKILRHGRPVRSEDMPNFKQESKETNLELAYLWSSKGFACSFRSSSTRQLPLPGVQLLQKQFHRPSDWRQEICQRFRAPRERPIEAPPRWLLAHLHLHPSWSFCCWIYNRQEGLLPSSKSKPISCPLQLLALFLSTEFVRWASCTC